MRWRQKHPERITRWRSGFLWWPRKIGLEWRWWEFAVWAEEWSVRRGWSGLFWETADKFHQNLVERKRP